MLVNELVELKKKIAELQAKGFIAHTLEVCNGAHRYEYSAMQG
jgi:hypothetical protein